MTWTRAQLLKHVAETLDAYRHHRDDKNQPPHHAKQEALRELGDVLDVEEFERSPIPFRLAGDVVSPAAPLARGRK